MGKDWLRVTAGRGLRRSFGGAALYSPTEATREVNVMTGVKKGIPTSATAFLTSAKLLFVGGLFISSSFNETTHPFISSY
jgi:hypothetical protein